MKVSSKAHSNMEANENTIKIFQSVKKQFTTIAIYADKSSFHKQQLFHLVTALFANILQCVYLICVAKTTREYMISIYMTTFGIAVYIAYWSAILKSKIIFLMIDDLEATIRESEFIVVEMKNEIELRVKMFTIVSW